MPILGRSAAWPCSSCDAMPLPHNAFKSALQEGRRQLGIWSTFCSPIAAEILGKSGFDWILFDSEHSPVEIAGLLPLLQAANNGAGCLRRAARVERFRAHKAHIGYWGANRCCCPSYKPGGSASRRTKLPLSSRWTAGRVGNDARRRLRTDERLSENRRGADLRFGAG